MTGNTVNAILFAFYIFAILPLVGALFGGCYNSYGEDDKYQNCIGRGILVHIIVACLYLFVTASYYKLTS